MMKSVLDILLTLTVAGSAITALIVMLPIEILPVKWRYKLGKAAILLYLAPVAFSISWLNKYIISHAPISQSSTQNISDSLISGLTITTNAALLILSLWVVGVISFMAWQLYCYRKFMLKLEQTSTPISESNELSKELSIKKQELNVSCNIRLMQTSYIRSPILAGFWKPTIYVPKELSLHVDMSMVFHHELVHLKRKDLWVKALTLAASCLHWFNPLVHILHRHIHTWSELSCDGEVVEKMSFAERKRYGETILSVMAGSDRLPAQFCASLSGDGKQLKNRLTNMLQTRKQSKKMLFLSFSALLSFVCISTTIAIWASSYTPNVVASSTVNSSSEEIVHKQIKLPNTSEQKLKEHEGTISENSVPKEVAVSESTELQPIQEPRTELIDTVAMEESNNQNAEIVPLVSEQLPEQGNPSETNHLSVVYEPIPIPMNLIHE